MYKSKKHAWHQTICVHVCKINAPHTHILIHMKYLPRNDPPYSSSALSCIMYACRNILGKMVIDILGQLRHTAFVATCS